MRGLAGSLASGDVGARVVHGFRRLTSTSSVESQCRGLATLGVPAPAHLVPRSRERRHGGGRFPKLPKLPTLASSSSDGTNPILPTVENPRDCAALRPGAWRRELCDRSSPGGSVPCRETSQFVAGVHVRNAQNEPNLGSRPAGLGRAEGCIVRSRTIVCGDLPECSITRERRRGGHRCARPFGGLVIASSFSVTRRRAAGLRAG